MNIPIKKLSSFSPAKLRTATVDQQRLGQVKESVLSIIDAVRQRGDAALLEFTQKFDGVTFSPAEMRVKQEEIDAALKSVDKEVIAALKVARDNIKKFHAKQRPVEWEIETTAGITPGLIIRPLDTVGVYVPGGKAFYPSTVLMTTVRYPRSAHLIAVAAATEVFPTPPLPV